MRADLSQEALHSLDSFRLEGDGCARAVAAGDCRPHKVGGEVPLRAGALQVRAPELELHTALDLQWQGKVCSVWLSGTCCAEAL